MELPVYDLVTKTWLPESCSVTYRNCLLTHLFPDVKFAIGDCSDLLREKEVDWSAIGNLLDAGFEDYQIVGASGSRKHGRILYAKGGGDYFNRFFGSNANAINYGSNLTTECKSIVDLKVKLLVVKDGEWRTGDCHGKMAASLAHKLTDSISNPIQFRAANITDCWMGKGTIAYSYEVSCSKYDLILPTSCFKGNKLACGEYEVDLVLGVVFSSPKATHQVHRLDWRRANLSYSVVQYLPWEAVEADILPGVLQTATEINAISTNQRKLAEYLLGDEEDEDCQDDDEYVSALARIVKADVHCQLSSHPWVVDSTAKLLRARWMRLATAGSLKFNSSMVMPDESLPDDCIFIPGLPDGEEVVIFPYPCRWKHDIKVWRNVKLEYWLGFEGILVVNTQTALKLGRDFDGDYVMWLPARKIPAIAAAIKEFGEPAIDQGGIKPKKNPVVGTLGEIAVKSMSNDTGLITWLIAKAWALRNEGYVNQLVPQLQAAVDSLKGAAPPSKELLDSISQAMKDEEVAWLRQNKESHRYLSEPITDDGRQDTISRLVREVNKLWIAPTLHKSKFTVFAPLFPEPKANWLNRAKQVCAEYSKAMAYASREEHKFQAEKKPVPRSVAEACNKKRKEVIKKYESLLDGCTSEKRIDAVGAFWASKHHSNSTDQTSTYICFLLGIEEICKQLQTLRINKLHLLPKFSDNPDKIWQGEVIGIKLIPHTNNYLFAQDMSGNMVGCLSVNDSPTIFQDIWFEASLQTRFNKKNQPSFVEAIVLDNF